MSKPEAQQPPQHSGKHEALAVFLGRWRASGTSFGDPEQTKSNPKAKGVEWKSTHTAHFHSGAFFLVQDERAFTGGAPFDTLSVMGFDEQTGRYFARSFENHGFSRHYQVDVSGKVWTFEGEHERARIEFSADDRTQTIAWQWRPEDGWLPLCDRVAVRED